MEANKLRQSYKDELIKVGVEPYRAEQAAQTLTRDELQMIGDIWSEWAALFYKIEREIIR